MVAKVFKTDVFVDNSEAPLYTFIMKVPNKEGYEKIMAKMFGGKITQEVINSIEFSVEPNV